MAVPTITTIFDLDDEEPQGDLLIVEVYGHMWWWEYRYPEFDGLITANELHIPTGRPIRLKLRTIEPGIALPAGAPEGQEFTQGVIHSFWVPKLAGKQDVVPGRVNKLTIEATEPGVYYGQCAEYCNLAHADMRLRVVAREPADFDRWVAAPVAAGGRAGQRCSPERFPNFHRQGRLFGLSLGQGHRRRSFRGGAEPDPPQVS